MIVQVGYRGQLETFTADSFQDLLSQTSKKYSLHHTRIRLKNGDKVLKHGDALSATLTMKDLGPQISWKLVFILEYLGPLLIHPIVYFSFDSPSNKMILLLNVFHYLKREFETLYVHRFSNATMPWTNLPKNCMHYWIFGGFLISLSVYSPYFIPSWTLDATIQKFLLFLWCFFQVSNLKTHLILRDLRPEGTRERKVPFGYGFTLVSCPNYFFEIMGWIVVSLLSGSVWVLLFTALGTIQMISWAIKKHEGYHKEFSDYPSNRTPIFPWITMGKQKI